jgi:hypothetical protein
MKKLISIVLLSVLLLSLNTQVVAQADDETHLQAPIPVKWCYTFMLDYDWSTLGKPWWFSARLTEFSLLLQEVCQYHVAIVH